MIGMIGMIAIDYMYDYKMQNLCLIFRVVFFQDFLCLHCAILCILTRIDVLSRAVSTLNVRQARAGSEKDEAALARKARVMQRRLDE